MEMVYLCIGHMGRILSVKYVSQFVSWHIRSVPASYLFPLLFIPRFHSNHHVG